MLELGLGSGVLSILAAKLGAASVTGLDINPQAVATARDNWQANGLAPEMADFRESDLFDAMGSEEFGRFDLVISNPPVLPVIGDEVQPPQSRLDFEVSGRDGRRLLDAVLRGGGRYLAPGGCLLTIATSLQGWQETEDLLATHWRQWEVRQTVSMELTEECTPSYMAYWRQRESEGGRQRFYLREGLALHEVWFLSARSV